MKKLILIISSFALFASCGNEQIENENVPLNSYNKGKELMELNCNSCHSSSAGENDRIAPPMIAIKKHYLEKGISKEDFIASIQKWIKNPSEDISKMPNAVKKFGVMTKIDYPKEIIKEIADYLYSNDIEKPEWFDEHYNSQHGKKIDTIRELSYVDIGMKYALSTKSQLGKNLMKAIQSKGTEAAISFCNTRAIQLTDSMAVVNNAKIKRVSDKTRNPNNEANEKELAYISIFKSQLSKKEMLKPLVEESIDKVYFYMPIKTNAMCLQCHGTVEKELKLSTYDKLKVLYPNDQAIGYSENEIRGIWSIEFDK